MRRRDGELAVILLEWVGLLGRAGVVIAIAGLGFATLGLLHP